MAKLNQILAVEKGAKGSFESNINRVYHQLQQVKLVDGFSKTYKKLDEEGEDLSDKTQLVQLKVGDAVADAGKTFADLINITAAKDFANTKAKADVVVDGVTLAKNVPATHLLFLEKKCIDFRTLISKIPTLDPSETWDYDEKSGIHKALPVKTERTKKVDRPITLAQATKEHPAQAQLITEDIQVGTWTTVKQSGAIPETLKKEYQERVEKLVRAVKMAREEANLVEVDRKTFGKTIFDFVFEGEKKTQ